MLTGVAIAKVTWSVTDELPGITPLIVTEGAVVDAFSHTYPSAAAPPVVPAAGNTVMGLKDAVSM